MTNKPKLNYAALDWSKSNLTLSMQTGVSKKHLETMRRLLGKPKNPREFSGSHFGRIKR